MPTYHYECSYCENQFEAYLPMAELDKPSKEPCPNCKAEGTVRKIIVSSPAVVRPDLFKGLSSDHRYAMKQMKKRHPKSNIPDY